jgi:Ig-like domain from next to BRCA1 gene
MRLYQQFGAVLFCFATALANSHCFGQENGTLVSVLITNGTPVAPRSMFTQTWTFENNGTKVWVPGPNGFTLNMVGLDSLGAIPYCTNAFNTNTFPRAVINSGKAVVPGGTGSYSMEFIAPEASGSYTDSFQLSGTNWFGPIVTVQVAVEPGGNTNVFDRSLAISYANNYATNVCSDGYFWTNTDYPDFGFYGTGVFTPVPTGPGIDGGLGDDCAHFVSCCIGNEPHVRGGGINVPSRTSPTYGEPSATDIVVDRLLGPGYAVEVSSLSQLEPGDVIGWNWEGDTNVDDLDHVTLYEGNNLIASHAISAADVGPTYFQSASSKWVWHLIHILDYPTVWTTRSGTSMTFSWTTNWNNYALYSASSLGGPWSKITTKPTVTGITNKLTRTMPSSGSVFYRLEMP